MHLGDSERHNSAKRKIQDWCIQILVIRIFTSPFYLNGLPAHLVISLQIQFALSTYLTCLPLFIFITLCVLSTKPNIINFNLPPISIPPSSSPDQPLPKSDSWITSLLITAPCHLTLYQYRRTWARRCTSRSLLSPAMRSYQRTVRASVSLTRTTSPGRSLLSTYRN